MKLNAKSLVRALLQIGGTLVTTGVLVGHSADIATQVVGIGSIVAGVLWGQVNATKQSAETGG